MNGEARKKTGGPRRLCRFCGAPLAEGASLRFRYCSEACRRAFQNEERKKDRALARERRETVRGWMQADPWSALAEIDEEESRHLLAGIDPLPPEYWEEGETVAGPLARLETEKSPQSAEATEPTNDGQDPCVKGFHPRDKKEEGQRRLYACGNR